MAIVSRCCCSLCHGHGLQARQGLLRAEGGGRACGLGCIHPRCPPTPLLSLLLIEAMFVAPLYPLFLLFLGGRCYPAQVLEMQTT